jgi:hypothetical protein
MYNDTYARGGFTWKNKALGEPIDICNARLWVFDYPVSDCNVCGSTPCLTYEVTLKWETT